MGEIKVRRLDDAVIVALKARAKRHGVSLEEEVRGILSASIDRGRKAFLRRAAAIRAEAGPDAADPDFDSVKLIREERDAWG